MSKRMTVIFEDEGLYTALKVAAARNGRPALQRTSSRRLSVSGWRPRRTRSFELSWKRRSTGLYPYRTIKSLAAEAA